MNALIRRLLVVLLLVGATVVAVGAVRAPSYAACPPQRASLEQQTMDAAAVFTAVVVDRTATSRTVTYDLAVSQVYKGRLDGSRIRVTTDARRARCGLPGLQAGSRYVVFAERDGDALTLDRRGGTRAASAAYVARVEALLGAGRPAVPPAPVEANFTRVADQPDEFRRIAAPGAALVLVGLLGLALVAWRTRRRG